MSWILPSIRDVAEIPIDSIRTVLRERSASDPVNRVRHWSKKRQDWLRANKENVRAYQKAYSKNNREKLNAKNRERYRNRPERRAYLVAKQRRYRERNRSSS